VTPRPFPGEPFLAALRLLPKVGLAKTRIFSLLEARSGALWFGSITGGASRYDGKSFKKFTEKEGLGNNDVMWIFEDRDANIWFGTGNGVSRYDGKSMTNFTKMEGLVHNSVYPVSLWAGGRSRCFDSTGRDGSLRVEPLGDELCAFD
jgi:ligand-binding sensor domain-containing protein